MAKPKKSLPAFDETAATSPRPRLKKLIVRNFRCIGDVPVEIDLDDVVVLVGPNNVGKSSILRAYEVVMSEAGKKGELGIEDFPNSKIESGKTPEIEIHTIVYDDSPGERWFLKQTNGEIMIRERWLWPQIGKPIRQGFDREQDSWVDEVPWGAAGVAQSRRPEPHRVNAFDAPESQTKQVVDILKTILNNRVEDFKTTDDGHGGGKTEYEKLLDNVKNIQERLLKQSEAEIKAIEKQLTEYVGSVFTDYEVKFDAKSDEVVSDNVDFFKANPTLLMGPKGGYLSAVADQGSGAKRTILWSALRIATDTKSKKSSRPHILLIDEPEICLHPNAIREACNVLYSLPQTANWQVMITTHSPQFIDLSKDNTTIIRVEKDERGVNIKGTTLYRPSEISLSPDDKENMKMLNICDPYVAEFFFGGKVIVVEGDTEYTAFKHIVAEKPQKYKDIHVIRARGKATIVTLAKILNHFGAGYSILHDSDKPTVVRKGKEIVNGAWSLNDNIRKEVEKSTNRIRLVANYINFETAYFNEQASDDKPYNALSKIKENPELFEIIENLLSALIDHKLPLPDRAIEWVTMEDLNSKYQALG